MDMMTAVGDSPLHVLVSKLDAASASSVLERVASAVKLRTWPELEEVPTSASKSSAPRQARCSTQAKPSA
jgi:hypothetical protein